MKIMRTGFLLLAALGGLSVVPQEVNAVAKIVPGTICNQYNASQAADIDYLTTGVRTVATSSRPVICAVPREASGSSGAQLTVAGSVISGSTMPITVYTAEVGFGIEGSVSVTGTYAPPATTFGLPVSFTSSQAPPGAYISVLATLPANGAGVYMETYADH